MESVFNPIREVKLGDGTIVAVREMPWPHMLHFLQLLAQHLGGMTQANGDITVNASSIAALVSSTDELSRYLLLNSTKKDEAWLESLGFSDGLALLDVALELSLNDEVMSRGKNLAGRIKGLFQTRPTQSENLPRPVIS